MREKNETESILHLLVNKNEVTASEVLPRLIRYSTRSVCALSSLNCDFHTLFRPDLNALMLMQAVIDNKKIIVEGLLNKHPYLLLKKPIKEIESKLTWQRFLPEKPLKIAIKRGQTQMIKKLLPYFYELEKLGFVENGEKEALTQWDEAIIEMNQQRREYDFKRLMDIISKEDFIRGDLSKKTQDELDIFRNTLLSNDFDIKQLLIAAHETYRDALRPMLSEKQRFFYCIQVIGFLQSLLSPENAPVLCQGLKQVIDEYCPIDKMAESYQLVKINPVIPFYRESRDSQSGLGSEWYVGSMGGAWSSMPIFSNNIINQIARLKKLVEREQNTLQDIKENLPEYMRTEYIKSLP